MQEVVNVQVIDNALHESENLFICIICAGVSYFKLVMFYFLGWKPSVIYMPSLLQIRNMFAMK